MAKKETEIQGYVLDVAKFLEEKKAKDVIMLNVSNKTDIAEWFVLATALNATHARALCDELEQKISFLKAKIYKREGQGEWLVLDMGDVIVHVFTQEVRNFYHLEKIWNDGKNEITLAGLERALIKEQKRVEAEERKNKIIKEKQAQKKQRASAKGGASKNASTEAKAPAKKAEIKSKTAVKPATKAKKTELKTKAQTTAKTTRAKSTTSKSKTKKAKE